MKQYDNRMKRGIIISIMIVILTFGIAGTVAAVTLRQQSPVAGVTEHLIWRTIRMQRPPATCGVTGI